MLIIDVLSERSPQSNFLNVQRLIEELNTRDSGLLLAIGSGGRSVKIFHSSESSSTTV